MGRVEFSTENKRSTSNFDYPRLKLEQGETARIVVGLEAPMVGYVHTLRKPQVQNGRVVTETLKRKDETEYQGYKKAFISNPLCTGREEVLEEKGIDPQNCLMCALHKENQDFTDAPKRRYAMHVVRYRTKGNTDQVQEPFSLELIVWGFTDMVFNKLVDIRNDIEGGDLRKHDLILGPCTNKSFQKFEIRPSLKKAEWMADQSRGKLFLDTFQNNQIPDLMVAIGSAKQESWIKQDIETIREAWAEVRAAEAGNSTSSLNDDLSTLLDKETKTAPDASDDQWATTGEAAEAGVDVSNDDMNDLLASIGASSGAAKAESAPVAEETPVAAAEPKAEATPAAPAAEEPKEEDFEDLLKQMG